MNLQKLDRRYISGNSETIPNNKLTPRFIAGELENGVRMAAMRYG
jgi:hypothetical protein